MLHLADFRQWPSLLASSLGSSTYTLNLIPTVTNWLYYDSIYTERYMSTPSANPEGYLRAAVNNVTAFSHVDFAFAHGSGDDNVDKREAYRELYEWLTAFLDENWGRGGTVRGG